MSIHMASSKEASVSVFDFEKLFHQLNGSESSGFPTIHAAVHNSPGGALYLQKPGVALIARPNFNMGGVAGLLDGFDPSLRFSEYSDDPTKLPDAAQLCTVAGQVCYMSFGLKRTFNEQAERYF